MNDAWPFADPRNVAVITVADILDARRPILSVWHDEEDGMWQFLTDDDAPDEAQARVVALDEIVALDPSVAELADLPLGWCAWRHAVGHPWKRGKQPPS
jgi:hypothetical protein